MRTNSGSSSRSGSRPARHAATDDDLHVRIGLNEDVEDWIERTPHRARGKTRRAIRRQRHATPPPSNKRANTVGEAFHDESRAASVNTPSTKFEPKRRPFWKNLRRLCFLLCFFLAAEGMAALLSSPHFGVADVQVQGAGETPNADLDTIRTSLIGQNFLRVNRRTVLASVQKFPTVETATLSHDWMAWPPRLVLTVVERKPFARVGAGSQWWVVDESGVPFRAARREDDKLYAVTGPRLEPKAGLALNEEAWKPVVQFAVLLNRDAARSGSWDLRRVYFDRHGFASLRLTGGKNDETLVQLGADSWPQKLQTARWALNYMATLGRHAETINLISSSVATWTPRTDSEPQADDNVARDRVKGTRLIAPTSGTPDSSPI